MALNTNIAMGVQPIQLADPMAQYSKMVAIQGAQQQNALAQQQMAEYERARGEEENLRNYLTQSDLTKPETRAGLARFGKTGLAYGKALTEQDTAALTQQESAFKVQKAKKDFVAQAQRDTSQNPSDANITAYKEDLIANPLFTAAEKQQMIAGADRLLSMPVDQRRSIMSSQGASASELAPKAVAPGGSLVQGGQTIYTAPAAPTNLARLQTELAALPSGDPRRGQYEALIRKETTHAPGTTVNVSTEKKYGERFGGLIAERDAGKLDAAEKAPQLATSANRIIDLVKQGDVFTGPAADIKLNIARALNVAGADNQTKIANTESLIAASGQSTLDAIKSAGLGTGQGFTDKDLKFLQGIAGGTVNLTAQTLTELATLQHRAATRSAEAWNKRSQELPKEALQGTGLSTAPIKVPPLSSGKAAGPSPGTVQDGYRFKGGNPADAKNWEKM